MVNLMALELFPTDAPLNYSPVQVCVHGDGNYLFCAASLLLAGCEGSCISIFTSGDGKGAGALQ